MVLFPKLYGVICFFFILQIFACRLCLLIFDTVGEASQHVLSVHTKGKNDFCFKDVSSESEHEDVPSIKSKDGVKKHSRLSE